MRARVAAWVLAAVALACGVPGAIYASDVFHYYSNVEPTSMGVVIAEAMRATILMLLAGGAVIGLLVLRGVAEMLGKGESG